MTSTEHDIDSGRVFGGLSPKKIILQGRSAGLYLLSKWKIILLVAILFGLLGVALIFFKKPQYAAEITFTLDEGSIPTGKTSFSELGEELGLGSSLDAGGVFSNISNIGELLQSRIIFEKTLRSAVLT